jgi:quercetin 2,3-dioxygenase
MFTIIARAEDTADQMGISITEGPAGPLIPVHYHEHTHEAFYMIEGGMRLWLDDRNGWREQRLMRAGDFAWIPAGTIHAFRYEGDYTKKLALNIPGGFERLFPEAAAPYEYSALAAPAPPPDRETWDRVEATLDVIYLHDYELFE